MKILYKLYEDSDIGFFLDADVQYPKEFHDPHNDLSFLLDRMKARKVENF